MASGAPQYLPPVYRHPLGLPAGSVRALLVLLIVAQFSLFLLLPLERAPGPVPLYLYPLMLLVLLYFVARGKGAPVGMPPQPAPLHLPRGTIRVLMFLLIGGALGWAIYQDPERVRDRMTPTSEQLDEWPYLVATFGGCFLLGRLLRLGPWRNAAWFQDFLAWVSLLAMIALAVELCLTLFVSDEITAGLNRTVWECTVVGIATTYFAARS